MFEPPTTSPVISIPAGLILFLKSLMTGPASLRRAAPYPHQSLLPRDSGGSQHPVRFAPGTVALGAWAVVTSALVAIWAVMAVVGGGPWFPWWALIVLPWIGAVIWRTQRRRE